MGPPVAVVGGSPQGRGSMTQTTDQMPDPGAFHAELWDRLRAAGCDVEYVVSLVADLDT